MTRRGRLERGSVTAEFAVIIPAVLLVLAFALAAITLAAQGVRCQAAASVAARSPGRGEPAIDAGALVTGRAPGSSLAVQVRGDFVCVNVTAHGRGLLAAVPVSGTACSPTGGR